MEGKKVVMSVFVEFMKQNTGLLVRGVDSGYSAELNIKCEPCYNCPLKAPEELGEATPSTSDNTPKVKIVELISELEDSVACGEDCHQLVTKLKYAAQKL